MGPCRIGEISTNPRAHFFAAHGPPILLAALGTARAVAPPVVRQAGKFHVGPNTLVRDADAQDRDGGYQGPEFRNAIADDSSSRMG
jgi:hypothetical protein